jgi:hypothetical protein
MRPFGDAIRSSADSGILPLLADSRHVRFRPEADAQCLKFTGLHGFSDSSKGMTGYAAFVHMGIACGWHCTRMSIVIIRPPRGGGEAAINVRIREKRDLFF